MKFTRADESTLTLAITEAVSAARLTDYGTVRLPPGFGKKTLGALEQGVVSSLTRHLDDSGLEGFVNRELRDLFLSGPENPPEKGDVALIEFDSFAKPLDVAKRIVTRLKSLPLQYRAVTRFSRDLGERGYRADLDIKISDQLRVVSGKILKSEIPLTHPSPRIRQRIQATSPESKAELSIKEDVLYFEFRCSGAVTDTYDTRLGREFSDILRSFYGGCISAGIIDVWSFSFDEITPALTFSEVQETGTMLQQVERLETDLVRCVNLDTTQKTDERIERGEDVRNILQPVTEMFGSSEKAKLTTAAIWLLRAHLSTKGMDKILESTIALEVLLGDREMSDRIGLSKLMANRCAYSLGRTSAERREITEFFSSFYRVRSEIVHSGRFTLSSEDRHVVDRGLDLASRVLRHEISLSAEAPP